MAADTPRRAVLVGWLIGLTAAGWVLASSTAPLLDAVLSTGAGPDAAVAAAAACLAWAVLLWLSVAAALCVGEAVGLPLARLAAATAPRALRSALRTSVGVGLVTATFVTSAPAHAVGVTTAPPVSRAVDGDQDRWPSLDRPTSHRPGSTYRVHPGDTLWDIAAAHLSPGAPPSQVARAWPAWWRANRDVIGDDPDLIRPGQVLRVPAAGT